MEQKLMTTPEKNTCAHVPAPVSWKVAKNTVVNLAAMPDRVSWRSLANAVTQPVRQASKK